MESLDGAIDNGDFISNCNEKLQHSSGQNESMITSAHVLYVAG